DTLGKKLFEIFPGNPLQDKNSAAKALHDSLDETLSGKKQSNIKSHRSAVDATIFEEFFLNALHTPVKDDSGVIKYIILRSENIAGNIPAEERKHTTKQNFEYFLNQAFAPFAILTGKNFVFTFVNKAYHQLMNSRELVGKPLEEAIPELKGQEFISLLKKVFDTGIPYHFPEIAATALYHGDSTPTTRYFNLSYIPFKNDLGETEGILATGYDITEQVELKEKEKNQLVNNEAYNLFMQAPVGFSLLTGDSNNIELVNATALRFTGRKENVIGKAIIDVLPEIEAQGFIQLLDRVKQNGETFNLKETPLTLLLNGKEERVYLNIFFQPYYIKSEISGVLCVFTDVTEQVLAARNVEELRERFETMANNIPNLAWIADSEGWIFWYNNRWYEYTGTTPEEMEGWGWKSVHDPETLPAVLEQWQRSIDDGKPFEMIFPIRGADNVFRPFLTRVVPIHDEQGKIIRWLGTNTDITRQKEIERMKDDFLSIASHELKTPLTTIKAYSQIVETILEKKGDTETLGLIKRMISQVGKLTTLIEDLLDITKIQKGKLAYNEEFFDFNKLVKEAVDDMQKTSFTHEIVINQDRNAKVFGDRNKISQVIDNLISNALKYSPKAEKIIVTTRKQKDGVQLSVQDFGIGISAQEQQNIFEQFYRVSGDRQATFPGLGIGLYICSEIIARQGGKIWVESVMDKGSVFYFRLPFDHRKATL
ncbi:MAG: PAS domain-containing protein, partial [Bacteroidota bacterium]|nr:PAS domain-containing protein [Bacteroidota bacterium]